MKAALKAPSPKIARKWFGSLKATTKASATGPAPRIAAVAMSRRNPVTRETSVPPADGEDAGEHLAHLSSQG